MMVETSELICVKDGVSMCKRSVAIRFSAVLSRTTTQSALRVRRFRVSKELYGWTTTSLETVGWISRLMLLARKLRVPCLRKVGEDAVSLNEFLGEPVRYPLQHVRTQTGTGTASNRMTNSESLSG